MKLTSEREASRGLFATAELLVRSIQTQQCFEFPDPRMLEDMK